MEINIKSIGYNVGTSGWLKSGLKNGEIQIRERMWKEKHALVLSHKKTDYLLAWFNDGYGYPGEDCGACYHLIDDDYNFDVYSPVLSWMTKAARSAVMEVAQAWCDKLQAARDNDDAITLKLVVEA